MLEQKTENRADIGKKAGLIGVIANLFLAIGKLVAGIVAKSTSIIADAVNNFSDGISFVITMIGFKLSQKPADADHPYGHARFEYLASLIVSIVIMFVGFELAKSSIEKIISPQAIDFSLIIVAILSVSIIAKLILCVYNAKTAKRICSSTLKATAADCRNDAIVTSVILIATIVEYFTGYSIDGFAGLFVAGFILFSGIMLVRETSSPILGKKNDGVLKEIILKKLEEYPIVVGYHDLMIHDYGPGISFCSIHFEVDKNLDPLYVHELIDKFEREMGQYGTTMTVHYDPVVIDSPKLNEWKRVVVGELLKTDCRLSLHDFRSIPCDGFTKVFFDIPLPEDLQNKKSEIKSCIENKLNELQDGVFQAEITFESYAFN